MAGYGAAYCLSQQGLMPQIFDKNSYTGGHTFSDRYENGFVFDEGPHISFTKNERIQELFASFVDDKYELLTASANNYYEGNWVKHPAQCNLFGLPADLVTKIILEFSERSSQTDVQPENYEQWLRLSYGDTFAEKFPMRYGLKYHTAPPSSMSIDWLGPRLYQPDLEEVILGALSPVTKDVHYISNFRYPSSGGFYSYFSQLQNFAKINLNQQVVSIDADRNELTFKDGSKYGYDHLISSIPLPELIPMIVGATDQVKRAASMLSCTECVIVNIGIAREDLSEADWSYIYDEDVTCTRLSFPYKFSPKNAPEGCSSVQAELYFSNKYKPREHSAEHYIPAVIADLKKIGLVLETDEIVMSDAKLLPYANVVFDHDRASSLALIQDYLKDLNIESCGRYGEWAYYWTDESFESGERAAEKCL